MTWFKIDDTFAYHRKTMAAGNAALGLWVRAGAYCAQQLTDGFVSREVIGTLGTAAQARRLVTAGLWRETDEGYQFHDWADFQPSREDVTEQRQLSKERQARWRMRRATNASPETRDERVSNAAHGDGAPTRPDPTYISTPPTPPRGGPRGRVSEQATVETDPYANYLDAPPEDPHEEPRP